jgi:predicted nuclease of predicted toxin-antitoxin system
MWGPTATSLRGAGHDVDWVGDWPADPGDRAILEYARDDDRVLITLDNDFGELAVRYGIQHHGIIRVALTPVSLEASVCLAAIAGLATSSKPGPL